MTKTFLVPLDGSPLAERALPAVAWLARDLEAEVQLLTVTMTEETGERTAYLEQQASSIGLDGVAVDVVSHRQPAAGIFETVEVLPDAALCMSTRGEGGWAEVLLGSVSDEVLRTAQVPAVLIGPHCVVGDPPSRNLVVAIDGSDASLAVLPTVASWTHPLGLTVHVVTVAQVGTTGVVEDRAIAAHQLVDTAAEKLTALGVDTHRHVLNSAYPGDSIVAFATGLPAALIATGTHGRGGLSGKALGSIADHIVRHAPCPVLVRRIPN